MESSVHLEIADQCRFLLAWRAGNDRDAVERRIEATEPFPVSQPGIQSPVIEDDQIEPFHESVREPPADVQRQQQKVREDPRQLLPEHYIRLELRTDYIQRAVVCDPSSLVEQL